MSFRFFTDTYRPNSSAVEEVDIFGLFSRKRHSGASLSVTYTGGRTYVYFGVPNDVLKELAAIAKASDTGASVGAFIHREIRDHYACQRA